MTIQAEPIRDKRPPASRDGSFQSASRHCRALWWLPIRGRLYPVVPLRAFWYATLIAVVSLVSLCLAEWNLERRAGSLTQKLRVSNGEWLDEDATILHMDLQKVQITEFDCNYFPLWHSRAFPVRMAPPERVHHRILVVGDSFVWGDGYANMNDVWWRQLQRELNHRGYWDVDVVALGVCSASTQMEWEWLRHLEALRRVQPDVIIWGYVANDPDMIDEAGKHFVKQDEHQVIRVTQSVLQSKGLGFLAHWLGSALPAVTFQLDERLSTMREYKADSKAEGYPYAEWELKLLEGENFEAYKKLLGDIGQFVRSLGIPCFFLTVPNYPDPSHFRPCYQAVAPEFQKAGLPFHDIVDAFAAQYPVGRNRTTWGINPANGHPGTCATHFFATQAADVLETEYRDALGPKTPPPPSLRTVINDWMPPWMEVEQPSSQLEFSGGGIVVNNPTPNEWSIKFPAGGSAPLLFMPIRKPHVLLCFEHPVSIESIDLTFPRGVTADLYASVVDQCLGYDSGDLIALGERTGTSLSWSLSEKGRVKDGVNTLLIAGGFLRESQPITAQLRIRFASPPVRP